MTSTRRTAASKRLNWRINSERMKVLLINGSPNQTGCTYTALHEVETTLQANGIETELLYLGKKPIAGCIACGACMKTGHCFRDDLAWLFQSA